MSDKEMVTIGCDLGDRTSVVCVLGEGQQRTLAQVKTTPQGMREFFERPAAHVIIEVGPHSRWVAALLKQLGHQVTIANPRRLKLISASDSKSDRADAELLARLGRADASLLAPVQHRGMAAQADLAVPKVRDVLVESRTRLINCARGLVKSFGARLPTSSSQAFHKKAGEAVPPELLPALKPLFATLEAIDAAIRAEEEEVARLVKKYPDVEVVSQPQGVGLLTALVFILTLEDKTRFKSSRQVGAYLGLRPKKDQSGAMDKHLHITKAGDGFLRRLLVNCATYIISPRGRDTDLRRWGLEVGKRGGKNGRARARVAVARKLAVLMHRLWVTGEEYKPLGYAAAA